MLENLVAQQKILYEIFFYEMLTREVLPRLMR